MRALVAMAFFSFGMIGSLTASHKPATAIQNNFPAQPAAGTSLPAVDGDRERARPHESVVEPTASHETQIGTAAGDKNVPNPQAGEEPMQADSIESAGAAPERGAAPELSLQELCDALASSAKAHDLPLALFANLIWQESRFDPRAVSPVGAEGVAQFMPATAVKSGLENPFDPLQAIPASAHLLHQLYRQFGNFGLAAAAYNAGPGRIANWLAQRGNLPRETRSYVLNITGLPAEQWRGGSPQAATFRFAPRLPCRRMPVFAEQDNAPNPKDTEPSDRSLIGPLKPPRQHPAELHIKSVPAQITTTALVKDRTRRLELSVEPPIKAEPPIKVSKLTRLSLLAREPVRASARQRQSAEPPIKTPKLTRLSLVVRAPARTSAHQHNTNAISRGRTRKIKIA
jgi:hypothetical protein